MKPKENIYIFIVLVVVLVFLDLWTKRSYYSDTTGVMNTGAMWGLQVPRWISFVIGVGAVLCLFYFLYKKRVSGFSILSMLPVAVVLLVSGIVGNSYDRLMFHGVRDRISLQNLFDFEKIFGFSYPYFNIADVCIVIGVVLLMIEFIILEKSREIVKKSQ